jgi:hypothetical protein
MELQPLSLFLKGLPDNSEELILVNITL